MVLVLKHLIGQCIYLFREYKDPRTAHLPLVGSPFPVLSILIAYLYFVNSYGPKFMENRKPYDPKTIINIYNFIQIILNLFIGVFGLYNSYLQTGFSVKCQPLDVNNESPYMKNLINLTYLYYLVKIIDLLDTVFFVLRKKFNQITFLHVYHHAGMVFGGYITSKFLMGSHVTLLGVLNAFVHVIMYGYYFLTNFRPELRNSLWWKKHITQIQLIQFGILVLHFGLPLIVYECRYPKGLLFIGLIQNVFMLILFSDFYIKAYMIRRLKSNK